jgi:hypothetical protein
MGFKIQRRREMKRYWEIIVFWEDQEPRTFYLEYDKYPMQVIIEVAQAVMDKHGAVDYSVKEIWKEKLI